jgi:hypothetical protein
MRVQRQHNKALKEKMALISYAALPNLFQEFRRLEHISDTEELTKFLTESPLINSCYLFYDAAYIWLINKRPFRYRPIVIINDAFIDRFCNHMAKSDWKPLLGEYLVDKGYQFLGGLTGEMQKHSSLISNDLISRIPSIFEYT